MIQRGNRILGFGAAIAVSAALWGGLVTLLLVVFA